MKITRRKRKRYRLVIAVGVFLVLWPVVAWLVARFMVVTVPLPRADALVVLSSSEDYRERSQWAAQLFREGRAPLIIVTNDGLRGGWSQIDQRNLYFFESIKRALENDGVPSDRILVLPNQVSSTYSEALEVLEYADQHKPQSLLLVTSRYHSRRALWTWRRVFHDRNVTLGIEIPPQILSSVSPLSWWLSVKGWRHVAGEVVKLIWYRLSY